MNNNLNLIYNNKPLFLSDYARTSAVIGTFTLLTSIATRAYASYTTKDEEKKTYQCISKILTYVSAFFLALSYGLETHARYKHLKAKSEHAEKLLEDKNRQINALSKKNLKNFKQLKKLEAQYQQVNGQLKRSKAQLQKTSNTLQKLRSEAVRDEKLISSLEDEIRKLSQDVERCTTLNKELSIELNRQGVQSIPPISMEVTYGSGELKNTFEVTAQMYTKEIFETTEDWHKRLNAIQGKLSKQILEQNPEKFQRVYIPHLGYYINIPKKELCGVLPMISEESGTLRAVIKPSDFNTSTSLPLAKLSAQERLLVAFSPERMQHSSSTIITSSVDGKVQAMAIWLRPTNELQYLISNPENVPLSGNTPVRGAGTSIILFLAKKTLETGKALRLTPLTIARPFYERLGFEQDDRYEEGLKLTANKIRELIEKGVPPFDQLKASA